MNTSDLLKKLDAMEKYIKELESSSLTLCDAVENVAGNSLTTCAMQCSMLVKHIREITSTNPT